MSSGVWPNNSLIVRMSLFRICSCKLMCWLQQCRVVSSFLKIGSKGLDKLNFSPLPFPLQKPDGSRFEESLPPRVPFFPAVLDAQKFKAFWRNPSGLKMEPIKFRIPSSEPESFSNILIIRIRALFF